MALAILHSSAAGARSGDRRGLDHRVFNSRIGRDRAEKDILPAGAGWLSWLRRSRSAGAIRARPERSDLLSILRARPPVFRSGAVTVMRSSLSSTKELGIHPQSSLGGSSESPLFPAIQSAPALSRKRGEFAR